MINSILTEKNNNRQQNGGLMKNNDKTKQPKPLKKPHTKTWKIPHPILFTKLKNCENADDNNNNNNNNYNNNNNFFVMQYLLNISQQ